MGTKEKTKRKIRNSISVLLLAALVIVGVFAFLTSTDAKTNVFTVGNVKAELWEKCDVDGENGVEDDENFGPEHKEVEFSKIFPGETRDKAPYMKNTGSNPAWMYMVISVPYITDGTASGRQNIDIKSYAIQDGYQGFKTSEEIWEAYNLDVDGSSHDEYTGTDYTSVFTLNNISSEWTKLDEYVSDDGHIYYTFAAGLIDAGDVTDFVFESVTLCENEDVSDKIKLIFKINGVVSETKYCDTADDTFTVPTLVSPFTVWEAENGSYIASGASCEKISDYYVTDENSVILNEKVLVFEAMTKESAVVGEPETTGATDPFVKLVPSSEESTAMIERDCIVETYNTGFTINPYMASKYTYTTPLLTEYGNKYTKNPDTYFVYGFDEEFDPESENDNIDTYVRVQGDGYYVYEDSPARHCGTGAIIKVYDRMGTENTEDDVLVEQFYIIIFGDVNGDSVHSAADYRQISSKVTENKWSTVYKVKAADLNCDGAITASDYNDLYRVLEGNKFINQITGLAEKVN